MRFICLLALFLAATPAFSQGLNKKDLVLTTNTNTRVRVAAIELGIQDLEEVPLYDHFALGLIPLTNTSGHVLSLAVVFLQVPRDLEFRTMYVTPTDDLIFKFETPKKEKVFYKIGGVELAKRAKKAGILQGFKDPVKLKIEEEVILEVYNLPLPPPNTR